MFFAKEIQMTVQIGIYTLSTEQFAEVLRILYCLSYENFKEFIFPDFRDTGYVADKYNNFQHSPLYSFLELDTHRQTLFLNKACEKVWSKK